MLKKKSISIISIVSIFILSVFVCVAVYNLLMNLNYFHKKSETSAKVENYLIRDDILYITVSDEAIEYCVKSTKSTPELDNLCWKKIENNDASISVYGYKKYYIWVKDAENNISNPISINTSN